MTNLISLFILFSTSSEIKYLYLDHFRCSINIFGNMMFSVSFHGVFTCSFQTSIGCCLSFLFTLQSYAQLAHFSVYNDNKHYKYVTYL